MNCFARFPLLILSWRPCQCHSVSNNLPVRYARNRYDKFNVGFHEFPSAGKQQSGPHAVLRRNENRSLLPLDSGTSNVPKL